MKGISMALRAMNKMPYGGDWYPEQWDRDVWLEDIEFFKKAGIDLLRLNIFAWTLDQPDENTWNFQWLDDAISLLAKNGIKSCLGTGTGAHPSWMAARYPDILRVDFQGRKRTYGSRHNSCPNSPAYRRFAPSLAQALAERYKNNKNVVFWNISNEFGPGCYCENCTKAFHEWLKNRYGTLDALNTAWNSLFWSQSFAEWEHIDVPNELNVQWSERGSTNQPLVLDYLRFSSDSTLECFVLEYDAIKKAAPDAVITTNLMGTFRPLDYHSWAKKMDIIGWDNYPSLGARSSKIAMSHDLMRGLKDGMPFLLLEQTPSQTNWQPYNSLKRPGSMRLLSWQAVARGADSVMFFQMRRSRGGCEKFHGAVIEHSQREDTRVFREVSALGEELKTLGSTILDSRVVSKVALIFDWNSWWALENSLGPSISLNYLDELEKYHRAIHGLNIMIDIISSEADVSGYDLVLAPLLYMNKAGLAGRIEKFVSAGGIFVTGFLSGVADDSDLVFRGGAPGPLKEVLGIWVEETDALPPEQKNSIVIAKPTAAFSGSHACSLIFDVVHTTTAETVAVYGSDYYKSSPVVTRNPYGKGSAWYVATSPDESFLKGLMVRLTDEKNIAPVIASLPEGIEASRRVKGDRSFVFLLNHTEREIECDLGSVKLTNLLADEIFSGKVRIPGNGALITEEIN